MDPLKWLKLEWDRAGAWVSIALGVIALLIGWWGVSGNGYPAAQLPYVVSGGIGGVFLLGLGAMLWLSADLRDEWRKLDRIEEALRDVPADGNGGRNVPLEPYGPTDSEPGRPRRRPLRAGVGRDRGFESDDVDY